MGTKKKKKVEWFWGLNLYFAELWTNTYLKFLFYNQPELAIKKYKIQLVTKILPALVVCFIYINYCRVLFTFYDYDYYYSLFLRKIDYCQFVLHCVSNFTSETHDTKQVTLLISIEGDLVPRRKFDKTTKLIQKMAIN